MREFRYNTKYTRTEKCMKSKADEAIYMFNIYMEYYVD